MRSMWFFHVNFSSINEIHPSIVYCLISNTFRRQEINQGGGGGSRSYAGTQPRWNASRLQDIMHTHSHSHSHLGHFIVTSPPASMFYEGQRKMLWNSKPGQEPDLRTLELWTWQRCPLPAAPSCYHSTNKAILIKYFKCYVPWFFNNA